MTIGGATWMGKTRLLEELTDHVSRSPGLVLTAHGSASERGLPYGIAGQILRAARQALNAVTPHLPDWVRDEIARLSPGRRGAGTVDADAFGEVRLLEGLYEAVAAVARLSGPVLLTIDDAHWADEPSATFIAYLARRSEGLPIMIVLTLGQTNPGPDPISDVSRIATNLTLRPLTALDLLPRGITPEDAQPLISATGGVPLLIEECIRTGSAEGTTVNRYLKQRTEGLSEVARQVLAAAAVLDRTGDVTLIREISGRSETEVVEAIEELVVDDLIRELPDGSGLALTIEALRTMTYETLTLARRRLLHRRAAEALAARPRSSQDLRLATAVAAQFQEAGDSRAGDWYHTAGDLARIVHANDEAVRFYETAAALGAPNIARIRLALGELAMARGDYRTAHRELTIAATMADGSLGLVEHRLGELHRLLGRFELASEHYGRAALTHPQPANVYADWAMLHLRLGDNEAARAAASEARRLAGGDIRAQARVENVCGVVETDFQAAMAHFDRAIELATSDELSLMAALNNKAHALAGVGRVDDAVPLVEQAIDLAAATGHRHREAALRNHLADLHHRAGRAEESTREQTLSVSLFADVGAGDWEPEVWLLSRW
jgi:tetratricopeptide (TPR) repeat protein